MRARVISVSIRDMLASERECPASRTSRQAGNFPLSSSLSGGPWLSAWRENPHENDAGGSCTYKKPAGLQSSSHSTITTLQALKQQPNATPPKPTRCPESTAPGPHSPVTATRGRPQSPRPSIRRGRRTWRRRAAAARLRLLGELPQAPAPHRRGEVATRANHLGAVGSCARIDNEENCSVSLPPSDITTLADDYLFSM